MLCPLPGCEIEQVERIAPDHLVIVAHHRREGARCPDCDAFSTSVHSCYDRHPADLPSFGQAVRLRLRVRRFYCHGADCRRRTFAELLPALLQPRARRTRRLARAQSRIGLALGGEAGARLLPHLAMTTSPDTLLRLVRALPLPTRPVPRVIGIDDWAIKKGRTYGTILVDLEKRRVIDLLPDRSGATVAAWLRRQPGIRIIARDRSTECARAATIGAPKALQVADRWHLLLNMRQALERWLAQSHGRLRRLPVPLEGDGRQPGQRLHAYRRSDAERAASADSRTRWLAAYEEVRRRYLAGETLQSIGRATGLARATIRKYAHAETFPERAARRPNKSRLDPYLAYLEKRLTEGCENAMALWREVRDQGFRGTHRQVHRWVAEHRTAPAPRTPHRWLERTSTNAPEGGNVAPLPSPKQLAWLMVQPVGSLVGFAAAAIARVEQDPEAAQIADLARRFTALVRSCGRGRNSHSLDDLGRWLTDAQACGVRPIETFAEGLKQDGTAVRAALTTPWSNGQAEGQITRLKLLKRTMYGRASFDLLRRRVLLAA